MRLRCVSLLFAVVLRAQDPLLWGNLEPGPHFVGFQSSVVFDASRNYDAKAGRPILLNVWYPATPTMEPPILYGRDLRVPDVNGHTAFRGRLETFVRNVLSDDLFHRKSEGRLNEVERTAFDRLLSTPTTARLDAAPAPGPFPVVLYHAGAGGSFEENSLLFEYLASHGYVVVSSAFQSTFPDVVGNNIGGIERSGPDLNFMAQQARLWPHADAAKLAAMGHSFGAQIILQWIGSPRCPARAFVSLDTTLEYTSENFKGHKSLRSAMRKLPKPGIPVILFARGQPGPEPRFSTFDAYLRNCPRYEANVAGVKHDDFLTHGYLGRTLMNMSGADVVRRSYEELCRTIRLFLDASLKSDAKATVTLKQPVPDSPVSIRFRPAN